MSNLNSLFSRVGFWIILNVVTVIVQQQLTKERCKEPWHCIHLQLIKFDIIRIRIIRKRSGARQSTWCIMSSQKKSRRKGTDSTRKKPASKSHAGEGWIAIPVSPSWMVPRWKSDKYPAEVNVLLADENPVGGVIHKSTLYATITSLDTTELSKCMLEHAVSCVERWCCHPLWLARFPPPQAGGLPFPAPGHHAMLQPFHCPTCGPQEYCMRGG